jgi:AraC-like DNA-binding protein
MKSLHKINYTSSFILISIFLFLFSSSANSQVKVDSLNKEISLEGDWKIMVGDDMKYADPVYNDSSWDSFKLPGLMIPYVRPKAGKKGFVWVRKTIHIDKNLPKQDIGLILGTISQADETFFNGAKIGSTGRFPDDAHSMWNYPRHYQVPHNLIQYGSDNVIAIRIYFYIYCDMIGTPAIANISDMQSSKNIKEFLLLILNYVIVAMGVPFFIIFFLFFIRRRNSQEYLYYALQLLCGLFIVLDACISWNVYGNLVNRYKILGVAWVALNVAHPIFLHRIYELKRKRTETFLWSLISIVVIIAIFFCDESNLYELGLLLIVLTTQIGFYNLSCHIYALYKKRPYSTLFSIFGMTVILGAMHDGYTYFLKYTGLSVGSLTPYFENMYFSYTAFMLYMGTSAVLVHRFISIMEEVEDLNTSLESFVIENALLNERLMQTQKKGAQHNLTDRSEEKIHRILSYIQDNYKFDISREGLAASINIHPDNLSKLFKISTNMKLGDYINEMRIKDAAKSLAETDEKVIDIAFSVGFDSLRTFNRVFPKFMKTTPEKYRKMYRK